MRFKKGNYLDETTLTKKEAETFVSFLESELTRHKVHLQQYLELAQSDDVDDFMRIVAQTVVVRNLDDIEHTQRTIDYLKEKWRL
jgi:hypothetical protein